METHAQYTVPGCIDRNDLAQRPCARLFSDPEYVPPTPEEVDGLIKLMGWSQVDTAKIAGVNYDSKKGSPTVRRWRTSENNPEHRSIPYAAWRLMLLTAGIVEVMYCDNRSTRGARSER